MVEHVPIGDRVRGAIPLRHPVAAGAEHPVESAAGYRQIGAVVGADDLVDQRVDRRAGDAGKIVRSLGCGRLRGEERPQAIARRGRHAEPLHGHVEIEILDPGAVLHGVDNTQGRLDAERGEILDVRRMMRLQADGSSTRNSILKASPFGSTRLPSLIKQPASCSSCVALRSSVRSWPEPSDTGGTKWLSEHLVRHLAAERLEQLQFFRRRRPLCHHVRVLERRNGALIGTIHDGLVGPLEIERLDQRLANPRIPEFVAAGIDEPALSRPRAFRSGRTSSLTRPSFTAGKS